MRGLRSMLALTLAVLGVLGAASPAASAAAKPIDLDVLFIGAHPDDEAGGLAVYGSWGEELGVDTGVITITRGEGGGNAVGPEEGAALGLLREAEERRAVGRAGIRNVYYLDKVDFYYTVSAPLTREIWNERRHPGARRARGAQDAARCDRDDEPVADAGQPRAPSDGGPPRGRGLRGGGGPVSLPRADPA